MLVLGEIKFWEVIALFLTSLMICSLSASKLTHSEAKKYNDFTNELGFTSDKVYVNRFNGSEQWKAKQKLEKYDKNRYGIFEIDRHHKISDKSQLEKAWKLYSNTYDNAKARGWFDIENGLSDSYSNSQISNSHYPSEKFLYDDKVLDPKRPEYLMYYKDPDTGYQKLLGVMFMANKIDNTQKQVGGSLTKWHYHYSSSEQCYKNKVYNIGFNKTCEGSYSKVSPEMLHVWFINRKNGPFATNMGAEPADYARIPDKVSKKEFKHRLWKSYPKDLLMCKR
jgi:hypothetical protein